MNECEQDGFNTAGLLVGLAVTAAAAGVFGTLLYRWFHQASVSPARDVKEIISQCEATIRQMDQALDKLQPSGV